MATFPMAFVDALKQQADIVTLIRQYVPLNKSGSIYKGLCPFHAETTPSFHVHREKGFFHCFGCGVGGDAFKFLELHEKVDFIGAVKMLAGQLGVDLPSANTSQEGRRTPSLGSQQKKDRSSQAILLHLPADLALDLDAFCKAHFDAPRVTVIREAIKTMIGVELASSPEFRDRYLNARREIQASSSRDYETAEEGDLDESPTALGMRSAKTIRRRPPGFNRKDTRT